MYSCLFRLFKRAMDSSANRRRVWKKKTVGTWPYVLADNEDNSESARRRSDPSRRLCVASERRSWLLMCTWSFRDRPGLKMTAVSEWDAISGSEKRRGVDSPSNPFLHVWKFADTLAKQRFQMAKRRCASAAPSCQNAFSRCRSHFRLTDLDPLLPPFSLRLGGGGGGGFASNMRTMPNPAPEVPALVSALHWWGTYRPKQSTLSVAWRKQHEQRAYHERKKPSINTYIRHSYSWISRIKPKFPLHGGLGVDLTTHLLQCLLLVGVELICECHVQLLLVRFHFDTWNKQTNKQHK